MAVIIDSASAARLAAEGAICFDTDTSTSTCEGLPVRLPAGSQGPARPILVCGSSDRAIRTAAERLESQGMAAWQVITGEPGRVPSREPDGQTSTGAGALSRAE